MRIAVFILVLAGCGSHTQWFQRQTAGHVGCPESEIQIQESDWANWTASCRGQTYYCHKDTGANAGQVLAGYHGTDQVNCAPAIATAPTAQAAASPAAQSK